MKLLFALMIATLAPLAAAQQPPLYPPPPNHNGAPTDLRVPNRVQPQWDERERHRQWRENRRWCREWREEHPGRRWVPERCR